MLYVAGISTSSGGKRQSRDPDVNAVPGQKGELLFVRDTNNNIDWLVDSGALYSIVPPTPAQRAQGTQENHLQAANGTKISCFGYVEKKLKFGSKILKATKMHWFSGFSGAND